MERECAWNRLGYFGWDRGGMREAGPPEHGWRRRQRAGSAGDAGPGSGMAGFGKRERCGGPDMARSSSELVGVSEDVNGCAHRGLSRTSRKRQAD